MPGFDGRGPLGQGPLTGGGRGRCAGYAGAGGGRGRGLGPCGGGRARGRGRGRGYGPELGLDPQSEAELLRRRLEQVEARQGRQDLPESE